MASRLGKKLKVDQILEAASAGNLQRIKKLGKELDNGKGIAETIANIKDSDGRRILHSAVVKGRTNVRKYVLEELNIQGDEKDSQGNAGMIQSLLCRGVDTYASNDVATSVQPVAQLRKQDIKVLLDHGANAPNLDVESKAEFPDLSERFTTDQMFESHQDLIDWANDKGKGCGTVVIISKYNNPKYRKAPRLFLSCEYYKKDKTAKRKYGKWRRGACPFQLRGVYIRDSKGKWKVKVHCGQHNHQLANTMGHSYEGQLKPDEDKLVREWTKSVLRPKHVHKPIKKVRRINTRSSLAEISIEQFWEVTRPSIDTVHNVASDGQCGFRAVAAGLEMNNLCGWLTVREELILELESFKKEYVKIYGGEGDVKRIRNVLGCTKSPCPKECWFTLPTMGHLVASRYNIVFVYISHEDALTFVPLRSLPPNKEPKVIAIGLVDQIHFVSIKLKPGCPIPQPVKIWSNQRIAERWGNLLKNRSNRFKEIAGHQPSRKAGAEVDTIIID